MLYKDVPFETACSSMCITLWIYMRSPMQMIACAAASIRTGHDITYRGHTARLCGEGEGLYVPFQSAGAKCMKNRF